MVKFFRDFPMCLLHRVRMRSPLLKDVIFKKISCQHYYWRYYGPPAGIMSHYFQCHELNHDKASLTDGMYLAAIQKRGVVVNTR